MGICCTLRLTYLWGVACSSWNLPVHQTGRLSGIYRHVGTSPAGRPYARRKTINTPPLHPSHTAPSPPKAIPLTPPVRSTIPNLTTENLPPYDYLLLCTKSTPDIPPPLSTLISPALPTSNTHTALILLQNGLNIHCPFVTSHPTTPLLSAISMIGSEEIRPGVVIHADPDRLLLGAFTHPDSAIYNTATVAAEDFVTRYSAAGRTKCSVSTQVEHDRWRKLVYNAVLNPVCALLGLDTGRLRLAGGGGVVEGVVRKAMQEIVEAARGCGVRLGDEVVQGMIESDPLESYLRPSMLVDVRKVGCGLFFIVY